MSLTNFIIKNIKRYGANLNGIFFYDEIESNNILNLIESYSIKREDFCCLIFIDEKKWVIFYDLGIIFFNNTPINIPYSSINRVDIGDIVLTKKVEKKMTRAPRFVLTNETSIILSDIGDALLLNNILLIDRVINKIKFYLEKHSS